MSTSPPSDGGKCAQCGGPRGLRPDNAAFPFCSARCKTIDLGKWLNGEYRIPVGAGVTERSGPSHDELEWAKGQQERN